MLAVSPRREGDYMRVNRVLRGWWRRLGTGWTLCGPYSAGGSESHLRRGLHGRPCGTGLRGGNERALYASPR